MTVQELLEALDIGDYAAFLEGIGELEPIDHDHDCYAVAEDQPASPKEEPHE